MYDLTSFTLKDMVECGMTLCEQRLGAKSMESVSNKIVNYFYENLIDKQTGTPACALIRCFKTHPYQELDTELQQSANSMMGSYFPSGDMKCLTLLATAGDKPEWNSRHTSGGHKAIPLVSEEMVAQFPMISQLIRQFGLDISTVLRPDAKLLVGLEERKLNVFYVPQAVGSSYIPAQDSFVIPCGIKSVLGFGGLLPSGNLFTIIMFSKVEMSLRTTEMFKTLAVNVKSALLPFDGKAVFEESKHEHPVLNYSKFAK